MTKHLLKRERMEGLIWLVLGVGLSAASIQLRLGNLHRPGPGFMPFLSGALLGFFGLVLLFFPPAETPDEGGAAPTGKDWKKLFFACLILLGYIMLFEPLGFFTTSFLFFFLLFKFTHPRRWLAPLLLSGGTVVASYFIFSVWLRCQLPLGFFHF